MKTYKVRIDDHGDKRWYKPGTDIIHNEDGPAMEYVNGFKAYCLNGKYHREDGPAIVDANGIKSWWINDLLHREDGPAIEYADGDKSWYFNGEKHRADGPAIERHDGYKAYYIHGHLLTEEEFNNRNRPLIGAKIEINGADYVLA